MKQYILMIICFTAISFLNACAFKDKDKSDTSITDERPVNKPNIIYILADDLGYGDLSIYGQEKFSTPNIDKLAAEGMLFTQHYSGSTVCAPSRSALLTGMHTGHTVVRGNKEIQPEGQYPIPDETYTLAESLKKSGYKTGAFGKWGLGFPGSEGDPTKQGFDTFYGYNCQRLGHNYYPEHLWSNNDSIVLENNFDAAKKVYAPELIHQETLKFIDNNKEKPFFLFVASIIPHAELAAPKEYMEKFESKFEQGEAFFGAEGEAYGDGSGKYATQQNPRQAYAAMVSLLDDQVGEIVEKLEEEGLTDNTIVVFTSDNGPHTEGGNDPEFFNSNGPFRGTKRDLYEGGIRVPMIVKWPGNIQEGSSTDHISAFWDIFPTFVEIVGEKEPEDIDGISFLPTLFGEPKDQVGHEYLYWEFHEAGGRQAVRMGDWKAVKYNVLENPDAPLELYDLNKDPGEKNNLSNKYPEKIKEMEEVINNARTPSKVFTFNQSTYLQSDKEL
ncbi:arylsulfatase [Gramella sp. AN32]|uniref:Arylsulfatase n=1 Tax=Christiangramia antarctica TaxID=2058158 RepID=A0ABW5X2B2_9FLAO|nr:arylsulfatase [Gramella sp. AN32]MCM4155793.1 arylsulfatase [Gramella sp. AN32]